MDNTVNDKILHIIDSLKPGGAEILLKNTIALLPEYEHLVVYFQEDENRLTGFSSNSKFIFLKYRGWKDILKVKAKLRKIIKAENPALVHSHLFLGNLVARLATPENIPLINTLHSIYSIDAFQKNKMSLWAERFTLKKRHSVIAVSKTALDDYLAFVPFKGNRFVLYNFLPDSFFDQKKTASKNDSVLKCIAIGNLKEAKNYPYLLTIMEKVKNLSITLDIYGDGLLKESLQKTIDEKHLNVRLCGFAEQPDNILSQYDLFIQASEHEGFGLSVIEATAAGLPVFISDIPVFREITNNQAHFFPLDDCDKAVECLMPLQKDAQLRNQYVDTASKWTKEKFSQETYRSRLLEIYGAVINEKIN